MAKKFLVCLVAFATIMLGGAFAQPPAPEKDGPAKKGGITKADAKEAPDSEAAEGDQKEPAEGAAKSSAASYKLDGDVVVLKNGKQLRGVKVLRVTPSTVELESGQAKMQLIRKQVDHIEYANKPGGENATDVPEVQDTQASDVMLAEKLSAEFHQRLISPIEGTPLEFKDQDALAVLGELAQKSQISLNVDEYAKAVPEQERKVTLTVPQGSSLASFLRSDFSAAAPKLKISYQFDKILVSSVDAPAPTDAPPLPPAAKENAPAQPSGSQ